MCGGGAGRGEGNAALGAALVNLTQGSEASLAGLAKAFVGRGPHNQVDLGQEGGRWISNCHLVVSRDPTEEGSFFVQTGSREAQCLHNGRPLQQRPRRLQDGDHLVIPTSPRREGPGSDAPKPCVALAFRAPRAAEVAPSTPAAPSVVCLTQQGAPRRLLGVDGDGSIDIASPSGSEAPAARIVGRPGRRPVFQQLAPEGSFVNGTLVKQDAECTVSDRDVIFPCKSVHKFRGSTAYIFLGGGGRMPATPQGGLHRAPAEPPSQTLRETPGTAPSPAALAETISEALTLTVRETVAPGALFSTALLGGCSQDTAEVDTLVEDTLPFSSACPPFAAGAAAARPAEQAAAEPPPKRPRAAGSGCAS